MGALPISMAMLASALELGPCESVPEKWACPLFQPGEFSEPASPRRHGEFTKMAQVPQEGLSQNTTASYMPFPFSLQQLPLKGVVQNKQDGVGSEPGSELVLGRLILAPPPPPPRRLSCLFEGS